MKKIFSTTLVAIALAASAASAQEPSGAKAPKDKSPAAASTQNPQAKTQKKDGSDCSPQRAGVRCSRPKPKNPWFFGK